MCTLRERYTYEIATNGHGGEWRRAKLRDNTFSRAPDAVARALLESWIIEHPADVAGGERIQVYGSTPRAPLPTTDPPDVAAKVRIRVYRGGLNDHEPAPAAVGYLGHDARDYPSSPPAPGAERWRRVRSAAVTAAKDRRVEAGAATVVALVAGYLFSKKIRGRGPRGPGA